jgi:hypothetical protein
MIFFFDDILSNNYISFKMILSVNREKKDFNYCQVIWPWQTDDRLDTEKEKFDTLL